MENNPIRLTDPDGMAVYSDGYQDHDTNTDGGSVTLSGEYNEPPTKKSKLVAKDVTAKADATSTASKVPKIAPKKGAPPLKPTNLGSISTWPPPEEVNYQDFGLRTTSLAIGTNTRDAYGVLAGGFEIKELFF